MLKKCTSCGISVERKDAHKNRYGFYVCRNCQASGNALTMSQRFRHLKKKLKKLEPKFWRALLWSGLGIITLYMIFSILESTAYS